MAQFYFLAVLLNIICGLICVYSANGESENSEDVDFDFESEDDEEGLLGGQASKKKIPGLQKIQNGIAKESLFGNATFKMVSAALCFVVGFLILFAPYKGPAVFGDLLPSLSALCGGAAVLVSYLEEESDFVPPEILDVIFVSNKLYIGIACILFGILHFIAPGAVIL